MSIGISDLAHSVRKNSAAAAVPVPLGHAQQLVAALQVLFDGEVRNQVPQQIGSLLQQVAA